MKTFYLVFLAMISLSLSNCSRDDDNNSGDDNSVKQKLIGKWYFSDPSVYGYNYNNSFTFSSDDKVVYKYWAGTGSGNNFDSETGSFTIKDDKLTMVFPKTVSLTYVQKVIFISDKKVEFVKTGNASEEPFDGTYYKAE